MEKKTYPGIRRMLRLNQTSVPYKLFSTPTALKPMPLLLADYSGFSMYDTMLLEFGKSLTSDYEIKNSEDADIIMDKAHLLAEAMFKRMEKTSDIMTEMRKEIEEKAASTNAPEKAKSNLIVEP